MKITSWNTLSRGQRQKVLLRPSLGGKEDLSKLVSGIIEQVKIHGDSALIHFTQRFDGVKLTHFRVTDKEFIEAEKEVPADLKKAIKQAYANILRFHKPQKPKDYSLSNNGIKLGKKYQPIEKVGFYIPAGSAPLISTLLMIGVPSQVAQNPHRVVISPPNKQGKIHPAILFTAKLLGIKEVYKVGGAQGIAALAYGTKSIPKVYKIFGPGNAFVTEAKQQVSLDSLGAAIDMPAGPSEVLIIADQTCDPAFVASDLLSQAEHDPRSQVICIVTRRDIADKINIEVNKQIRALPRIEIATKSLANSSILVVDTVKQAIEISNEYSPEHLILQIKNPNSIIKNIRNTGSVFIGKWTPESLGDYASGTNHVLPTYGYAKAYSGLSVEHFMRSFSIQEATQKGLKKIASAVEILAAAEGLNAHRNAVKIRR